MPAPLLFAQNDKRGTSEAKPDHQKGFTLIEILVVMLVGGMIMAAGLLSMYQTIWGTARTNDQVRALTEANVAAMWLKADLQMIQETPGLTEHVPSSALTMSWADMTTSFGHTVAVDHTIHYALNGTNLVRTFDGTSKTVGRNITSVSFTRTGYYIHVAIGARGSSIFNRTHTLAFGVYVKFRPEV